MAFTNMGLRNNTAMKFVSGLKSRSEEVRIDTAYELQRFATTELREVSLEELSNFLEDFNQHIYEMLSSHDINEKKGGIYAIMSLVDVDVGQTEQRISRFANYLQSLLNSTDIDVLELTAKAVGRLYLASGTYITGFVEKLVDRSFEWLGEERVESRRHAAVLVLRELALSVPTFFFQQVPQFLDVIFEAVRDPKHSIREGAVAAIRVALSITAQRETKESQQPIWYKKCLEKAFDGIDDFNPRDKSLARDDLVHGSLLVLNELLRCSNSEWERIHKDLRHLTHCQTSVPHKKERSSIVVKRLRSNISTLGTSSVLLQDLLNSTHTPNVGLENLLLEHACESRCCRELVLKEFMMICSKVLAQKNSRNLHIQASLLQILPRLAALDKEKFAESYLASTIDYLRTVIRTREREKAGYFVCLGLVAVASGPSINTYLPAIMRECHDNLPSKDLSIKKKMVDSSVCICISLMARGIGPSIQNDVKVLLDSMMASGLSAPLAISLQTLATDIPDLKRSIAEGLLRMLSQILQRSTLNQNSKSSSLPPSSPEHNGIFNTVLALRTLGTFNFDGSGQSLMPFVKHICDNYLTNEHKEIRLEAIPTCLHLLKPVFTALYQRRSTPQASQQAHIIFNIISKILWVCVSDKDSDVRLCVLTSFDDTFDSHLSQAENIQALIFAASDERFELREHAICILGRLSAINPSYILPEIRKILLKILNELDYSGIGRNRELSARLLGHMIGSAPRFMRNFVDAIMAVLIPKLKDQDPNPAVTMCILSAIGDLSQIGYGQNNNGNEMHILNDLLPLLLEMLGDGTSGWKRQVALVTLGQLVENMGYGVHPYNQYPSLLDILLSFLKSEQQPAVRRETLRVLGFLGALDPYKHKMNTGMIKIQQDTGVALICMTENKSEDTSEMTTSEMLVNLNYSSLEEFYPACAIAVLVRVIKDPTLVQYQNDVVRAVTFIFKSLGVGGEKYLSRVIPALINVIRTSDATIRDYLFNQLSTIIDIVKHHIRNYLEDVVSVLKEFWQTGGKFENTSTIITVVENIAIAVGSDFKVYLKELIPLILKTLINDIKESQVTIKLLQALQKFGITVEEYLHMILPYIVKLFDTQETTLEIRKTAIVTVNQFTGYLDLSDYISEIIHPLLRTIDLFPELRPPAMDLLCSLATQLGRSYENFIQVVQAVLNKHKIINHRYEILVGKVVKGLTITDDELEIVKGPRTMRNSFTEPSRTIKKGAMSKDTLAKAWSFNRLISKDDWLEWLRKLSIELMKSSPSPAIKACYPVAQNYVQLSRDLFNAAFVSCWSELDEPSQDDFLRSIKEALTSQDIPEITQTLLNLAEFMEHCDKGHLPLDLQLLGEKAIECRAYAKALHYKEEMFLKEPTTNVLESLIAVNNKLGQTEASAGLLEYCKSRDMKIQERWFEKLHDWNKALEAYQGKIKDNSDNTELVLGQMRCLEALGEWGDLYSIACQQWTSIDKLNENCKRQMSRISCAAAWVMSKWDTMEKYIDFIPRETQEGAYYRAVLAIHNNQFEQAQELIGLSRDLLDTELTAMVGESYQRSYNSMVAVQILAELEEVIQYKCIPDRRKAIKQLWWDRLQGCQRDIEDWQKILQVRSLVLTPQDDMRSWLKFTSMCRKMGRQTLAHKMFVTLLGFDPAAQESKQRLPLLPSQVAYQYCKYLYTCKGKQQDAFSQLQAFLQHVLHDSDRNGSAPVLKFVSRVYLKLGIWYQELNGLSERNLSKILHYLTKAKETDSTCYKAWHTYACTNFEALLLYRNKGVTTDFWDAHSDQDTDSNSSPSIAPEEDSSPSINCNKSNPIIDFAINACEGFARSIALSENNNTLQDTLRLLTVCFDYGSYPAVNKILQNRLKTIQIDNWLQVIPQVIARIDTPQPMVNKIIHQLLVNIGKQHPQALLYPLTVAAKSSELPRTKAADIILKSMREHSNELVNQAMMISEELIRTAILWHEKWYEGLEEASRLYYSENDIPAMFRVLRPLHAMLEKGPITMKEMSFNQSYGRDLQAAADWCRHYQTTNNTRDLNQAWDLYYQVFRRISKQLHLLTSLDLKAVSPRLFSCKDLDISVPGSYFPNAPLNKISCIKANIQVLSSKQKPRKLCIRGSIGHDFVFLLKGHEDLRQDERVMQLFGLVNTLLVSNPETFRRNLTIQRYAVIPLSTNSGLIGWVPNCDTLHVLIRDWRDKKKIMLTIEHKIMVRMAPDFDHLTLMQKVEVFEHALANTKGDDLAKLLWFKSPSSEVWFDRRTNYTRSLAVMSMVGYVLGLGDRHPSNLMLHQFSGKIVHIDFGDCFEVAMAREKFPEKIPFRLTRMLINAMEVTGIEGTYRMTCESVMDLLRQHKDSLMAMLEAFVYDPLLNWRLMEKDRKNKKSIEEDDEDDNPVEEDVNRLNQDIGHGSAPGDQAGHNSPHEYGRMSTLDRRASEAANKKALVIVNRVKDKLTGKDFSHEDSLDVKKQVELLIAQATSHENLCQCYIGWCPFW